MNLQGIYNDIQNRFTQQLSQAKVKAQQFTSGVLNNVSKFAQDRGRDFLNQPIGPASILPQPKAPTIGQGVDFMRTYVTQPIARIGAESAMTLAGDKNKYVPKDFSSEPIAKFLYGNEPLKNANDPQRPAAQFSQSVGMPGLTYPLIVAGAITDMIPWTSGKGKVAKELGQEGLEQLTKQQAKAKLKGLLNYKDMLVKTGNFTASEAEKVGYAKAMEYLNQTGKDVLKGFKSIAPEKQASFDKIFAQWIGEREIAKTTGIQRGSKFVGIPDKIGFTVINKLEIPTLKVDDPNVLPYVNAIKKEFDDLHRSTLGTGIDLGYLKNYITHIWKETPQEVEAVFKAAKLKFKFASERTIPTYLQGIKLGLTPKFTHPAEIIGEYTRKMEETKAGITLFNNLKKEGFVVDASIGMKMPGYKAIVAQGFPQSITKTKSGTIIGQYYAPNDIANLINRIFNPEQNMGKLGKFAHVGAKVSSKLQDITLSGGLPKSPLNAFSIMAGLQREILAGRVISPIADFVRSFSGKASNRFFAENVEQIKKMQSRNLGVRLSYNVDDLIDRGFIKNNFGDDIGQAWNATMNEPTFKRFFPALQVQMFNQVERKMLQAGKTADEAIDIAAKTVKNFYGLTSTADDAKKLQITKDFTGTFLFAPKFRESMLWFWKNNIKALRHPLATENQYNIRFVIGAIASYMGFDYANWQMNGKHLAQNPEGKKDKLLIPAGDTTIAIPYLSSIGTLPRALYGMVDSAIQGNGPEVLNQGKAFLSTPIRPTLDVMTNQNYFGQKVYDESDSQGTRIHKVASYLISNWQHPYMRAIAESGALEPVIKGKDQPVYQTLSKALELPFRYYQTEDVNSGYYFAAERDAIKNLSEDEKKIYEAIHKSAIVDEDGLKVYDKRSDMANALMRLANTNVLQAEQAVALQTAKETGENPNPFYLLSPGRQQVVLILKTFYPGDDQKKQIQDANMDWLKPYWAERDAWVEEMKAKGVFKDNSASEQPKPSPELQAKLDLYSSLPKGTGERTRYINANPDIKQFFDASSAYTNEQRVALGLSPLEGFTPYVRKGKTLKATKLKTPKIKKPKTLKAKAIKIKAPKLYLKPAKRLALRSIRSVSMKQPKLSAFEEAKLLTKGVTWRT